MKRLTGRDLFLKKIFHDANDCWVWTAYRQKDGYGVFHSKNKTYLAHRYAYEEFVGEIPTDLEIDHLCRNRACVNPKHLEAVTHEVNMGRGHCEANGPRIAAFHQSKTRCAKGHEYSKENTILIFKEGHAPWRICRACKNANRQKRRKLLRETKLENQL